MPKKPKYQTVRCQFYEWRLIQRKENGVWYADARTTSKNRGRHSLGTRDKEEALEQLAHLDRVVAEERGLVEPSDQHDQHSPLAIADGRKLFDDYNGRPVGLGGTKKSTQKRYRAILDKFEVFAAAKGIEDWQSVKKAVLIAYAKHLEKNGYARKTILGEITLLKTAVKWLIEEGHLSADLIKLPMKKADCERAYCYTSEEVIAILEHCKRSPNLRWLLNAIIGLACTGMRINELCTLKWSDIRFDRQMLTVADESGFANQSDSHRSNKSSQTRHLPLRAELLAVLESLPRTDQYIFHGPRGGRLKSDTVRNVLVREVITPLMKQFPKQFENERGFEDGRLHSFRHYFCSVCANTGIPERITMNWLGHADSEMVRHYYHLNDAESRRKMDQLNLLGGSDGCSATDDEQPMNEE
ncbi:tyrosine-type recombinase/integrase [Allorhodopirellula heiligendammensis]|uniref:Transposase n=1 Tax=Allorhodopirellula heiligendammensis TaxID=2714739 RepID=A0A5C6C681_9BACT|nr:tyrosine-type recombinase/integrase [Allorhodopirellula heiligendammensis]TWU18289.1 Transposase [Allorhodopirellula heiligendammensis]